MDALEAFRLETRAWLDANCPPEMRTPTHGDEDICWGGRNWVFQSEAQRVWMERMAARGWTVPAWPKAYGGGGLDHEQVKVLKQEMAAIGARSPLESFGIWMLGPALLAFGSEEQKKEHLPRIARGEIRWCQGYSEPNAGSDLASLQTRAEDAGDHFVVTGSKIWTSYADKADMIFCLVRTDPAAPKHLGISFVLFDMTWPGVSTKPITLISGKSPFCETFFDGVKVPKANLVGTLNRGWDIAKYLLTHEREMIGGGTGGLTTGRSPGQLAAEEVGLDAGGRLADAFLRTDAARAEVDALAFAATMARYKDEAAAGGRGVGDKSAVLKYYGTELNKRRYELIMRLAGHDGLEWEGQRSNDGDLPRSWLRTKANSIEGGTSEVMLDIVAKRLLDLPSA
ncbi:acyl-CoA dehydrogenase family protein [Phreatobacter sp. AB_2022a]|uniref:acyl-CoA dehydrogenase family protein n=1 Tax=Phreatobacter sp. AB_2022a TaxID=3003134 RepID=UPI00228713FE|nr:acyl-CoA dehydrogenase family protein [Phreatobacter sp. AB_2022a]MCZ0735730.1 acyl-CoA dehydrogenase family protein [Phreatobacter sp. AB_2022a]